MVRVVFLPVMTLVEDNDVDLIERYERVLDCIEKKLSCRDKNLIALELLMVFFFAP